jgi:hypothetical protein
MVPGETQVFHLYPGSDLMVRELQPDVKQGLDTRSQRDVLTLHKSAEPYPYDSAK